MSRLKQVDGRMFAQRGIAVPGACVACGKPWPAAGPTRLYCSQRCKSRITQRRHRARIKVNHL